MGGFVNDLLPSNVDPPEGLGEPRGHAAQQHRHCQRRPHSARRYLTAARANVPTARGALVGLLLAWQCAAGNGPDSSLLSADRLLPLHPSLTKASPRNLCQTHLWQKDDGGCSEVEKVRTAKVVHDDSCATTLLHRAPQRVAGTVPCFTSARAYSKHMDDEHGGLTQITQCVCI